MYGLKQREREKNKTRERYMSKWNESIDVDSEGGSETSSASVFSRSRSVMS